MKKVTSFIINKETSDCFKAIVLLLIIMGHNHTLFPLDSTSFLWLYSFHVAQFFILPSFYKRKEINLCRTIGKILARCLIPYTIFYIITFILTFLLFKKNDGIDILSLTKGYFHIGIYPSESIGMQFIWFLLSFCMMSILDAIEKKYNYLYCPFFIIGFWIAIQGDWYRAQLFRYIPLYIAQAFYYLFLAKTTFIGIRYIPKFYIICIGIFIIVSILHWFSPMIFEDRILSITAFSLIWKIASRLQSIKIITDFGKKSLVIYLIHLYVYHAVTIVLPNTTFCGYIILILTISISYAIALFLVRIPKIYSFFFPKSWNDWINTFCSQNSKHGYSSNS